MKKKTEAKLKCDYCDLTLFLAGSERNGYWLSMHLESEGRNTDHAIKVSAQNLEKFLLESLEVLKNTRRQP